MLRTAFLVVILITRFVGFMTLMGLGSLFSRKLLELSSVISWAKIGWEFIYFKNVFIVYSKFLKIIMP